MSEEESNALLRELLERLKAVEQRLESQEGIEHEISTAYAKSQELYRRSLTEWKRGSVFSAVVRLLILLLLAYIAYRVS
jgi:hypothetical protein